MKSNKEPNINKALENCDKISRSWKTLKQDILESLSFSTASSSSSELNHFLDSAIKNFEIELKKHYDELTVCQKHISE